ncbi:MAG: 4Fe-4S binding protein [Eubacteriales bacterium]
MGETQPAGKRCVMVNKEFCKGCSICVKLCPKKVFAMDGRGKAYVKNQHSCSGCGTCEIHCPDFAISLGVK